MAALLTCAGLLVGCSSSPSKPSSSASTVLVTASSFATIVATTTTSTTAPVETSTSAGPLLTPDDAHTVADCVKYIPIGAVIADDEATGLWDIVGHDYDELTPLCISLLTTSPATLASLSLKLAAFEITQAATTTVASTSTTPG